jgi:hypothetical protein
VPALPPGGQEGRTREHSILEILTPQTQNQKRERVRKREREKKRKSERKATPTLDVAGL